VCARLPRSALVGPARDAACDVRRLAAPALQVEPQVEPPVGKPAPLAASAAPLVLPASAAPAAPVVPVAAPAPVPPTVPAVAANAFVSPLPNTAGSSGIGMSARSKKYAAKHTELTFETKLNGK